MFDATNSTADRRKMIQDIVVNKWGYKLFFVESICDDPKIIEQNIMVSVASSCIVQLLRTTEKKYNMKRTKRKLNEKN